MASMAYAGMTRHNGESKIITASKQMKELFAYSARVAASDAKVLITGESGVGKDVIARHIHANSPRRGREYVAVNRGDEPQSAGNGHRRAVPGRSALSCARDSPPCAVAARPARGHQTAGDALPRPFGKRRRVVRRSVGGARAASLARQRARAAERDG